MSGSGKRGRPPKGSGLVDGLDGSEHARERLRLILETIAGKLSLEEACRRLDISESRFHEMRNQCLQLAVGGLEPGVAGRPPRGPEDGPDALAELKEENQRLRVELQAAHIREELAIAMPAYFGGKKLGEAAPKKTPKAEPPPGPGTDRAEAHP
jgi:hypothetical protein